MAVLVSMETPDMETSGTATHQIMDQEGTMNILKQPRPQQLQVVQDIILGTILDIITQGTIILGMEQDQDIPLDMVPVA